MKNEDFIDSRIKELEAYFSNEVVMSKIDQNGINYTKGKIDAMDDLIHNSSYDAHRDLEGYSTLISELSLKIEALKTRTI